MVSLLEIDSCVYDILKDVQSEGLWPSHILVVEVLLKRFSVFNLSQLHPTPIPLLSLLFEIEVKLDLFLTVYAASSRSICTLFDCEVDVVNMLKSFSLPPLIRPTQTNTPTAKCDCNEIMVDDDRQTGDLPPICKSSDESFESFGLGPLDRHPKVMKLFNLYSEPCFKENRLSTVDVLIALIEYRQTITAESRRTSHHDHPPPSHSAGSPNSLFPDADLHQFSSYLTKTKNLKSLASAGVVFSHRSNGRAELLMLRYIEASRESALVNLAKQQLELLGDRKYFNNEHLLKKAISGCGNSSESHQGADDARRLEFELFTASRRGRNSPQQSYKNPSKSTIEPFEAYLTNRVSKEERQQDRGDVDFWSSASYCRPDVQSSDSDVASYGPADLAGLSVLMPWVVHSRVQGAMPPPSGYEGRLSDVLREVGRWGEALVYNFIQTKHPTADVVWVNKDGETRSPYDIVVTLPKDVVATDGTNSSTGSTAGPSTIYIEVKTSRFPDLNVFDLSMCEWEFATCDPYINYHIYRVYNAGDPSRVHMARVVDIKRAIQAGTVRLCLAI